MFTRRRKVLHTFIWISLLVIGINLTLRMDWLHRIMRQPPKTWTSEESKPLVNPSDWIDPDAKDSSQWSREESFKRDIPKYVLDHAPLIHLHPQEPYWIADPAEFLKHVKPQRAGQALPGPLHLSNLARLNFRQQPESVCLVSDDDVDDAPPWMIASWNIPVEYSLPTTISAPSSDVSHSSSTATDIAKQEGWYSASPIAFASTPPPEFSPTDWSQLLDNPANDSTPGFSAAPGLLLTVAKENGVLDAFWFIFNSFNLGNKVFGRRYGNHIGDWEHVMIRFQYGLPKALYTSRHSFGNSVYAWDVLQKNGPRPIVYSARGSHAMYVTPGIQPYVLPFGILSDSTAAGPLWDPALVPGLKAYTYDAVSDEVRASNLSPNAATSWLNFYGRWGNAPTPATDLKQYRIGSDNRYSGGPIGPKFKNLNRRFPCESGSETCYISSSLVS